MTEEIYLKSGFYTCQTCKKYFTAHNRLYVCKEKQYACPYCKSIDWEEYEFKKGKDDE